MRTGWQRGAFQWGGGGLCGAVVLLVLILAGPVRAAPAAPSAGDRAATLTWRAIGANTAEFHALATVRRSAYGSLNTGDRLDYVPINFGDGAFSADDLFMVAAVDSVADSMLIEKTESHVYTGLGPFVASLSHCCRPSEPGYINNAGQPLGVQAVVSFAGPAASPSSAQAPVVDCAANTRCTFWVPVSAPSGGALRFRLATADEVGSPGFQQPGPPLAAHPATISVDGLYAWDTTGATLSPSGPTLYSTQIIIENLDPTGAVMASTSVDFLIRLDPADPSPTTTATATLTATPPCAPAFADVHGGPNPPPDYFYTPVQYLFCQGIVTGYHEADGTTTFRPYDTTSRGQFSKMIVLAYALPDYTPTAPDFADVDPSNVFYPFIERAAHAGIASGYQGPGGTLLFQPYRPISRGELCKLVVSAAGWPLANPNTATFTDVPPSNVFFSQVETAVAHGVISGYACGNGCLYFNPTESATRGQIAKILWHALGSPGAAR
ncbi:MAG TPA: S-layer homology domain-containing protein [Chloroflexia bacterium]|nr:S-layer homology domain-containing protein [Chloroflexia bacterium]